MQQHFQKIKEAYAAFEQSLLRNGKLVYKETDKGIWGVTHLNALFDLFQKLQLQKHKNFVDIGSGDGRVVLLASLFGVKAVGVECDPWLVATSHSMKKILNLPGFSKVDFHEEDFMEHELSAYDVVYCSPDKPFHRTTLEQKLLSELQGKLIVHGWEFQPGRLQRLNEVVVQGEKFGVYGVQKKGF